MREFPSWVYFFIFKSIIIEAHSLQMNDEIVWSFLKEIAFDNIAFCVATITLVIRDCLTLNILFERFIDVFEAFNFNWKRIEVLRSLFDSSASRASHLTAVFTSKNIFKNVLERSIFQGSFQFIEENVQKLLSILLNWSVYWHSFEVFEGEAKLIRTVFLFLSQ